MGICVELIFDIVFCLESHSNCAARTTDHYQPARVIISPVQVFDIADSSNMSLIDFEAQLPKCDSVLVLLADGILREDSPSRKKLEAVRDWFRCG